MRDDMDPKRWCIALPAVPLLAMTLFFPAGGVCAPKKRELPKEKMSFIDNGTIKVGVNLALGGAITWVSKSGSRENVVNSHDLGRQIQMSYYSEIGRAHV